MYCSKKSFQVSVIREELTHEQVEGEVTSRQAQFLQQRRLIQERQILRNRASYRTKAPKLPRARKMSDGLKLNNNIVCIRLSELLKDEALEYFSMDELNNRVCQCCGIYQNYMSNVAYSQRMWKCESCSYKNSLTKILPKIMFNDIEFINERIPSSFLETPKAIRSFIFCIDISGSMTGPRLETVKNACLKALDHLYTEEPLSKIVLTSFNDQGFFYTYDSKGQLVRQSTTALINRVQFEISRFNPKYFTDLANKLPTLKDSYQQLQQAIRSLNASGWTRISEALTFCTVMGGEMKNCTVVICTDGETEEVAPDKIKDTNVFFNKIIKYSQDHQVRFYTLRMDECSLQSIETISRLTGGKVEVLGQKIKSDFTWIIKETRQKILLGNYDSVTIMSNQRLVKLKALYESGVLNEYLSSNKIQINDFVKKNSREFYVEISLNENEIWQLSKSTRCEAVSLLIQIQLKSANYHRVITLPLQFDGLDELRHNYELRYSTDIVLAGEICSSVLVSLSAWRYLAYYLLERKDQAMAKRFSIENMELLRHDFLNDLNLESLSILLENIRNDASSKIDDLSTIFLSNIISETEILNGHHNRFDKPMKPASKKTKKPIWRPASSFGRAGAIHGRNTSTLDNALPLIQEASSVLTDEKIVIQTAIKLPPINAPDTKVYREVNGRRTELPEHQGYKIINDLNRHSVYMNDPLQLHSDLVLEKPDRL